MGGERLLMAVALDPDVGVRLAGVLGEHVGQGVGLVRPDLLARLAARRCGPGVKSPYG